ncbi:hypothetical protein ACFSJU_04420 [Paradesertivirga mongoliensis]|uniref:Uncharacterized protein n=1 Tax=Paradesertivirga mongoliensis TaxID=2100740 RepID=A0ABW4ZHV4_9SPHI|nr:hypothetical protein [Pedobacter mongoliensis]
MIIKKSIRAALASFLLLCFSAAVLPVDFFHDHSSERAGCSKSTEHNSCGHKLHITKKASFCFACTAHFDKHFSFHPSLEIYVQQSVIEISFEDILEEYISETILFFLRGPPSL